MDKRTKIFGLFLISLYAFFFASTTLFVHSHEVLGARIVHSHLLGGKAHSHTTAELRVIDLLSSETCLASDTLTAPEQCNEYCIETVFTVPADVISDYSGRPSSLRAPPCLFCL